MKSKGIYILVPEPCNEGWDKMLITADGRYCNSCAKTVIDFTEYTDAQLIEFFSKQKGPVCGHFKKIQLGRRLQPMTPQSRLIPVMLLTASMLMAAGGVMAQQLPKQPKSTTSVTAAVNGKTKQACKKVPHKKVKPSTKKQKVIEEELLSEVTGTGGVPLPEFFDDPKDSTKINEVYRRWKEQ